MSSISAVLIVKNEEKRIEACLRSVSWADELVVVDSGSSDRTLEIASRYTRKIYQRAFDNFSNQKNHAVDLTQGDWIFSIDADEVASPELAQFLQAAARNGNAADGYLVTRVDFIFGKRFRSQSQGSEKILRFFRKSKGRFEQPIHEKVVVGGRVETAEGELLHYSSDSIHDYLEKLNLYTDFEAKWMAEKGIRPKWYHFSFMPFFRFIYYYFFRRGFLDGFEGLIYHALSSFYYFSKYAKLKEIDAITHHHSQL